MAKSKMQTINMLVVDDNIDFREGWKRYCEAHNFRVDIADTARLFLERVARRHYDVIMMDTGEASSGNRVYDISETVRGLKPGAVIIGCSGIPTNSHPSFDAVFQKDNLFQEKVFAFLRSYGFLIKARSLVYS